MEEDTRKLLQECNAGCKMAIDSMEQVMEFVKNEELIGLIHDYKDEHLNFERESSELLDKLGKEEKEPKKMASAMSWMTTEMKLMMKNDSSQAAKLMMDGCNMGIQSVCKYQNQYPNASRESKELAERIVKAEENFMKKIQKFL